MAIANFDDVTNQRIVLCEDSIKSEHLGGGQTEASTTGSGMDEGDLLSSGTDRHAGRRTHPLIWRGGGHFQAKYNFYLSDKSH